MKNIEGHTMLMEPLNKIINEEIMQHKPKHDTNEVRLAILETTVGHINETLIRIEKRFDKIDGKLEVMDRKIEDRLKIMDGKIDGINNRIWTIFLWMLGTTIAIASKAFHWI